MRRRVFTIAVLSLALLGFAGGAAVLRREKTETVYNMALKENLTKAAAILNRDKDGDGLKDWEEELWHTNSTNPDTDGDGAEDAEEIRLGRNPAVAGPRDLLDEKTVLEKVNPLPEKPETETERLSREFFAGYLELKQRGGGTVASGEIEGLVYDTFLRAPLLEDGRRYDASDIKVADVAADGSGTESLRAYGNGVGTILARHAVGGSDSPFEIVKRALETENPEELSGLALYTAEYNGLVADLLSLPAPAEAAPTHLELINALQGIGENTAALEALFTDSIKAMPAIALYQKNAENLAATLRKLQALFIKKRIRFGAEESGYLLESLGV